MVVVKLYMWPEGDPTREHFIAAGTLDLLGIVAERDDATDLPPRSRFYRFRAFKGVHFGGPTMEAIRAARGQLPSRDVWRQCFIGGHLPHSRGVWDVLGGAIRECLSQRLAPYRRLLQADVEHLRFRQAQPGLFTSGASTSHSSHPTTLYVHTQS